MTDQTRVSAFLLERYHIGEVLPEEKACVEEALARDPALAAALAKLEESDRDFKARFPVESFLADTVRAAHIADNARGKNARARRFRLPAFRAARPAAWAVCAAALALVVALPVLTQRIQTAGYGDRVKGGAFAPEISAYLKDDLAQGGADSRLQDRAVVRQGNTIQLAYRVPADSAAERYGVIFSIDGRSSVTSHYPSSLEQSTRLDTGNVVALSEAYTLDDAPNYEIFFFVVKDKPLDARNILSAAEKIAPKITKNPDEALRQGNAAFRDCELQILTLQKE